MRREHKFMCITRGCERDAADGHTVCGRHLITDIGLTVLVAGSAVALLIGILLGAFR